MSSQKISAAEVAQKVISGDELFILDVRNESEFNDWKIEGKNITIINKPYFELLDGIDPVKDQFSTNQNRAKWKSDPIAVPCMHAGKRRFKC